MYGLGCLHDCVLISVIPYVHTCVWNVQKAHYSTHIYLRVCTVNRFFRLQIVGKKISCDTISVRMELNEKFFTIHISCIIIFVKNIVWLNVYATMSVHDNVCMTV